MEETSIQRYCEVCNKETIHVAVEDALEIEYRCTKCNKQEEVFKTYF